MSLPADLCAAIRGQADAWRELKQSEPARKGEDLDALRTMEHAELAVLAWDALNLIERLDEYSYLISSLQGHLEGPGNHQEGWVVAQADGGNNQGGFNKWSKASGGYSEESGPYGDWLIFENWKAAKDALDHKPEDIRPHFRIYPVVVSAGNEPRTTIPQDEHDR
jgi:hypothetical protein